VHALFATADDIDQMLGRSQAVRDFSRSRQPGKATISTRCSPPAARRRNSSACPEQGDVLQNDVPQVVMYFAIRR
jgi:hypothetical protein